MLDKILSVNSYIPTHYIKIMKTVFSINCTNRSSNTFHFSLMVRKYSPACYSSHLTALLTSLAPITHNSAGLCFKKNFFSLKLISYTHLLLFFLRILSFALIMQVSIKNEFFKISKGRPDNFTLPKGIITLHKIGKQT